MSAKRQGRSEVRGTRCKRQGPAEEAVQWPRASSYGNGTEIQKERLRLITNFWVIPARATAALLFTILSQCSRIATIPAANANWCSMLDMCGSNFPPWYFRMFHEINHPTIRVPQRKPPKRPGLSPARWRRRDHPRSHSAAPRRWSSPPATEFPTVTGDQWDQLRPTGPTGKMGSPLIKPNLFGKSLESELIPDDFMLN